MPSRWVALIPGFFAIDCLVFEAAAVWDYLQRHVYSILRVQKLSSCEEMEHIKQHLKFHIQRRPRFQSFTHETEFTNS